MALKEEKRREGSKFIRSFLSLSSPVFLPPPAHLNVAMYRLFPTLLQCLYGISPPSTSTSSLSSRGKGECQSYPSSLPLRRPIPPPPLPLQQHLPSSFGIKGEEGLGRVIPICLSQIPMGRREGTLLRPWEGGEFYSLPASSFSVAQSKGYKIACLGKEREKRRRAGQRRGNKGRAIPISQRSDSNDIGDQTTPGEAGPVQRGRETAHPVDPQNRERLLNVRTYTLTLARRIPSLSSHTDAMKSIGCSYSPRSFYLYPSPIQPFFFLSRVYFPSPRPSQKR